MTGPFFGEREFCLDGHEVKFVESNLVAIISTPAECIFKL